MTDPNELENSLNDLKLEPNKYVDYKNWFIN